MLVYFLETLEDESDKDYIIWLYNEFERLMYSTAFKYTTIPQIAEDIVQDKENMLWKIQILNWSLYQQKTRLKGLFSYLRI